MTKILYPPQLEGQLKQFRLSGMAKSLGSRLKLFHSASPPFRAIIETTNAVFSSSTQKAAKNLRVKGRAGNKPHKTQKISYGQKDTHRNLVENDAQLLVRTPV